MLAGRDPVDLDNHLLRIVERGRSRALRRSVWSRDGRKRADMVVNLVSFGYKNGVPVDADLVFDVRCLPNPHFVPELRSLTGLHPRVAKYIRSFPQTQEFINRISELLIYLLPRRSVPTRTH